MRHTRRTAAAFLAAAALACLAAAAVAFVAAPRSGPAPAPAATSMNGMPVHLDPGVRPVSAAASHAVDAHAGERFRVPSVGLDVPLGAMNEVDGQVTPPGFTSAYWIRNMGVPVTDGHAGTVYVVMHSLRGGAIGPGNYLTDVAAGVATVQPGAAVTVAGAEYRVTGWQAIRKNRLADAAGVWAPVKDRLVIITCLELPRGGPSVSNIVITATRR